MERMLSEIVETAVGFRAAVNVKQELDDFEKAAAFRPDSKSAEVLFDLGRQLEPRSRERQRLITGSYGTGKSHLALVLAAIYRGYADRVEPVLARLQERQPGRAQQLRHDLSLIRPEQPFLVVVVEGDQDNFDAALVRELRQALERYGLTELMPSTFFSAAAERVRELESDPEAGPRVKEAIRELGFRRTDDLLEDLEGGELASLSVFDKLHRRVCFGAQFFAETRMRAAETYAEANKKLIESGRYAGIVVIWDEFGAFMEQVVRDPGTIGLSIQAFAEACQDSGGNQLHLYLIAHRTLDSYLRRAQDSLHLMPSMQKTWEEDFKKTVGRFREFFLESESEELFSLIDDVLIQRRDAGWEEFVREHESEFTILTERTFKVNLFPDLPSNKLRRLIIEGCHPLHPATAAFLPRVARIVAQNQRTLFTFLCGEHAGTAADFLRQTPIPGAREPLRLMPADVLWTYFEDAIRADQIGQQAYRRWRNAMSIASVPTQAADGLTSRVLRILALFELVRLGDPERARDLPATEDNLAFALDLRSDSDRRSLREVLERLSQPGPNRAIVRTREGVYQMLSGGGVDLEARVVQIMEQRKAVLNVAHFLRERWAPASKFDWRAWLSFAPTIEVLQDRRDVISRQVHVVPLLPEEIENLTPCLADIRGGKYVDGYLFVVLPTEDAQLGIISKQALSYADNPQVIIARPAQPVRGLREVVARIDALEELVIQEADLWGEKGERREEWEHEYETARAELREMLAGVALEPPNSKLDLTCIWRGAPYAVKSWADVVELAEKAMSVSFSLTPKSRDEVMKQSAKLSGLKGPRRAVVNKLFEPRGADLLVRETDQAQARFVRLMEGLGMLQRGRKPMIRRPDPEHDAGAAQAWDCIVAFRDAVRKAPASLEILSRTLRSAPFGIGPGVLPILFAAALRDDIRAGNLVLEYQRRADWENVTIDGVVLDEAFAAPDKYRVRYVDVTDQQRRAIEGLLMAVAEGANIPDGWPQLLEETKKQVTLWWHRLPQHCRQTQNLDPRSGRLREEILQPLCLPDANAHRILVEQLRQYIGDHPEWGPQEFAKAFRELLQDIETACDRLRERVVKEVAEGLKLESDGTPAGLTSSIRAWYKGLLQATRDYCHQGDAGKLQKCLREGGDDVIERLATEVMGTNLSEWSDSNVGHFVGRLQSAKAYLESWKPPDTPPPPLPPPPSGVARLAVQAELDGHVRSITREFAVIPPDNLSECARMVLRLITSNLTDNPTLRDGERENILLELVRRVFGDE